jgi:Fungal specific transcription factor domain
LEDSASAFPTPPASSATDALTPGLNFGQSQTYSPASGPTQHFKLVTAPQQFLPSPNPNPTLNPNPKPNAIAIASPPVADPGKKFDILDIELIQHYCTRTYMTISSRLATHVIWRDSVFKEAFRHEWLLHGIMATAALHKAATQPESSKDYAKVALAYQNAALSGYIPEVSRPHKDNSISIFALSLLLTIWSFGSKDLPEGLKMVGGASATGDGDLSVRLPPTSPTLQFAQIITVLRGIYTIIQETDTWLQGDIEEMLRYPRSGDLPNHPPEVENAYNVLSEAIRMGQDQGAAELKELCAEQVDRLREISRCRYVVEWDGHIFSFFIMAPIDFINGIKQGNSMALAVFAHWAACFRCMDHHWWANGWPQTLVHDVCNLLDMRVWSSAMAWPMRECGFLFQEGASSRAPAQQAPKNGPT